MPDFILADDLSGALDAAGAFHGGGWRASVELLADDDTLRATRSDSSAAGAPRPHSKTTQRDLVALTTESRNDGPAAAAQKVARALRGIAAIGGRLLFKKIDSTMRGPVAAELEALAAARPGVRVLFSPANPAAGRTVREGVLFVDGVPVAETEFGRDPANPVRESSIRLLLGEKLSERVTIADAETQQDLVAAVARMNAIGADWIGVGSAALARAMMAEPRGSVSKLAADEARAEWPEIAARGVLMVCGSAHTLNREQAERLGSERGVAVHELTLANTAMVLDAAEASLHGGGSASLALQSQRVDRTVAVEAIVAAAARLCAGTGVRRIFVTGGETAFALCSELGIERLEFLDEIEPGVSVSAGESRLGPVLLAVKPGGFGDAATWVRVFDRLRTG